MLNNLIQGSHRVGRSGKGREFEKCIILALQGMEFSAGYRKIIENIIVI